jgi:hypothetical protein
MIMFPSNYTKDKDVTDRLQNFFTVMVKRNTEGEYKDVLQFKERLNDFINHETELVEFS